MADSLTTRPSLLVRLRDREDAQAWREFVKLYVPLIYTFARKRGLQDCDAADLAQDVLRAVATAAGRFHYDPERGSFRGWLFTVVRHKLLTKLARQKRQCQGSGDTAVQLLLEGVAAPEPVEEAQWEEEHRRRLLACAIEQVRGCFHDSTWMAFWKTAVEGEKPRDVARTLAMSVAAVYMAKSRVTAQLREQ